MFVTIVADVGRPEVQSDFDLMLERRREVIE